MKSSVIDTFLLKLDNSLRWTGIPARVADQMSDGPSDDRKYRPLRWVPIWPIVFSCVLLILSLALPSAPYLVGLGGIVGAVLPGIQAKGPLGKPLSEVDEREAALNKDSFLFCVVLIACLNCLGQPVLMILSHWQHWQMGQLVSVVAAALLLNITLFGCLPTLYASWKLRQLPNE
jgi:hypothetical protein